MLVVFHRYFCGIPSVLQALKNHADTGLISLQYCTVEYWEKTSGVFPMYFQLVIKLRDYYCGISSVFHDEKLEEYATRTEGKPKGFSSVLQTAWTLGKWMWFPPSLWHIFWVKIRMRGSRLQSAYSWTKYVAPPVVPDKMIGDRTSRWFFTLKRNSHANHSVGVVVSREHPGRLS